MTLTGADRLSQWQFPNVLACPVLRCDKTFETRAETIRHYRKTHSMNFQYCSICAKPVCAHNMATFKDHFLKKHPNASLPKDFFGDEEDDVIQLNGGNQTTEWRFTKSIWRKCPAENCGMKFRARSEIREHFKKRHTSDHFYCKKCDKLIYAHDENDFDKHQRNAHANGKHKTDSERSFCSTSVPSTSKVILSKTFVI